MDADTYQTYLKTSGKVAALASLLFVGVALLTAKYNWASFIQLIIVPVAYALPPPVGLGRSRETWATACALLELIVFVMCLSVGGAWGIGADVQCGVLALISVGLAADAAVHDAVSLNAAASRDQPFRDPKKMFAEALEVGPEYVLF